MHRFHPLALRHLRVPTVPRALLAVRRALALSLAVLAAACGGGGSSSSAGSSGSTSPTPAPQTLAVTAAGTGSGVVASTPSGITCASGTCQASFTAGTNVVLAAAPATGSAFNGWLGACAGTNPSCTVALTAPAAVTATFVTAATTNALSVTETGVGTVTSAPAGISCSSGTCSASFAPTASVTLTEAPGTGYTFTGWGGACSGTATTCVVSMSAAQSVSAAFATTSGGSACARSASSLVWAVPPSSNDFNFANKNTTSGVSFGNYIVAIDDWNSVTATEWVNSQACWSATAPTSTTEANTIRFAPNVTRGWIYNATAMNTLSTAGTQDWTTKSGMGIQLSSLTKAKARWAMTIPTTAYPASRWDALMDVFFHTMQLPTQTNGWYPEVDMQIIQSQMDSGYYAAIASSNGAQLVTLGGVGYVVIVDVMGSFNQTGGHTITMFARPTSFSDPTATPSGGFLWGGTDITHDLHAIIQFWMQSNPLDDSGAPIHFGNIGWNTAKGQAITSPILQPTWYFTAVNGDFEIDYGDGVTPWTTTQFWVSVQNEPDGP